MADGSTIEWTDHTFNPVWGCSKVSPGCDHCYAEILAKRFHPDKDLWGSERHLVGDHSWQQVIRWHNKAKRTGIRTRVFSSSMGDVFDNQWPDGVRERLWDLIRYCDALDWQLLTKRPQNIAKMLPADWGDGWSHVWLGVSVENQTEADRRIPILLQTPAAVRFLSCEPLLGPVDLDVAWHGEDALNSECWGDCGWCTKGGPPLWNCSRGNQSAREALKGRSGIDWVIAGGESGSGARPMHPDWVRGLRDQCAAADVPFLFKQWGEFLPAESTAQEPFMRWSDGSGDFDEHNQDFDNGTWHESVGPSQFNYDVEFGEYCYAKRIGKKAAGRLLDGREHSEFPVGATA